MNVAEIRRRSEVEGKLATLFFLKTVEQSEQHETHLHDLLSQIQELRQSLRSRGVALRFGYRNQIDEFVRCLFMRNLLSLAYDPDADDVVCRLTDMGRDELRTSPPEQLLQNMHG